MRIWTRNRWLSIAVAVGYALTITTASLFHNHAGQDSDGCYHWHSAVHAASTGCHHGGSDESSPRPNAPETPARCPSDGSQCSVCQFLGHKPAPVAEVAPVSVGHAGARCVFAGSGMRHRQSFLGLAEPRARRSSRNLLPFVVVLSRLFVRASASNALRHCASGPSPLFGDNAMFARYTAFP